MTPASPAEPSPPATATQTTTKAPADRAVDDPVDARDVVWAHRFQRASRLRRGAVVVVIVAWIGHAGWGALQAWLDGCEDRRTVRLAALQEALRAGATLPEGVLFPAPTPQHPGTQVLALDDGAALVVDGVIVGGGPSCRRDAR